MPSTQWPNFDSKMALEGEKERGTIILVPRAVKKIALI